ncbi:hypothetical protein DMR38_10860 [Clostridium sp. AWRP]|nr:hypothetical protein DMR38_10860 [Clostridium sp. AWRP]
MLKNLFQYLKRNNWEMVFFATTVEKYCMIKYKLISNGIKVKTKIIRHNGRKSGNEYYEIYIESKEIEKANKIIHNVGC